MDNKSYLFALKTTMFCLFFLLLNACETADPNQQKQNLSLKKAQLLHEHGLTQDAKSELINIIHCNLDEKTISEAYYVLGNIAFEEDRIAPALNTWQTLIANYPDSDEAKIVRGRIEELAEVVGEFDEESVENAMALSYLRHGDFWSRGKSSSFIIDTSWLTNVDAALKWYDKVINEFSGSVASRLAYQNKMKALLGWEESGRYGQKHGVRYSFNTYMPILVETFQDFEQEHPNANTLQAFRYQIAQAYWREKNWSKTREWLNLIIEEAGEDDSFYTDLAQRRLSKVEH